MLTASNSQLHLSSAGKWTKNRLAMLFLSAREETRWQKGWMAVTLTRGMDYMGYTSTVNGMHLHSAILVFWPLKALCTTDHIYLFTHDIHTLRMEVAMQACNPPIRRIFSFTRQRNSRREQFTVTFLTHGHIEMWTRVVRSRTTLLPEQV